MGKTYNSTRRSLGVKQEDLAVILHVNRSHVAAAMVGTRVVNPSAAILIAEMVKAVEVPTIPDSENVLLTKLKMTRKRQLERLLEDIKMRMETISKKLPADAAKKEIGIKAARLAAYFASDVAKELTVEDRSHYVTRVAKKALNEKILMTSLKLEIAQELLVAEQAILERKLAEI